mgnify:CR=1 FL=1
MKDDQLLEKIEAKYNDLGENHETYLKGLLHAKPINYWEYIGVDTLLSLQNTRTNFKDEEIFIMYHQMTELVLKMMVHEIKQLVYDDFKEEIWIDKLNRLNRYTALLITSFDVMKSGMSYEDYNTFRSTLTPASGFQSAQFRLLEIYCTSLGNLVNDEGKTRLSENPSLEEYFEHIYWKDAGYNRKTGKTDTFLKALDICQGRAGRECQRIGNHTGFKLFNFANFTGLFFDRKVLVNNANATKLGHRDCQTAFGDRIHRRRKQRDIQFERGSQLCARICLCGKNRGFCRLEQNIIKCESFADVHVNLSLRRGETLFPVWVPHHSG